MMCCIKPFVSKATIYPIFTPTEYLFENYPGHENMERWDIIGKALRDMMCEQTGLGKND